jgi:hypothetical protein
MDIEVKDPITGALLRLEAHPENLEGQRGFRILHPNGSGFFIVNRSGAWRSGDDHHVDSDMLINIGIAIEGGELKDQVIHPIKF